MGTQVWNVASLLVMTSMFIGLATMLYRAFRHQPDVKTPEDPYGFGCKPTPIQLRVLKSTADIVIYCGPAGSGKSMLMRMAAMMRARLYPSQPILTFWFQQRETWEMLDKHIPSIRVIGLKGINEACDQFAGVAAHTICIDGIDWIREESFWFLLSRLRSNDSNVNPQMFCSMDRLTDPKPLWLAKLVKHWEEPADGIGIRGKRNGIRHFQRIDGNLHLVDITKHDALLSKPISIEYIQG